MKKLASILLLVAVSTLAHGQGFFETATGYFTSFNTNLATFQNSKVEISTGADWINNVNACARLGIDYNITRNISVLSATRTANVDGVIVSQQMGIGYSRIYYDTKLTIGLSGGYDCVNQHIYVEPSLFIKKALTDNSFAFIGLSFQVQSRRPSSPILSTGVGFVF